MTIALIDNGSLEPAATLNLRAIAAALAERTGVTVHPVSWKHSDRIPSSQLSALSSQLQTPARTLAPFVRAQLAAGTREFLFIPFFISAQGAIGTALRADLEKLRSEHSASPFTFAFTDGLAARHAIAPIVAARIHETIAAHALVAPPVIVVDHGGPSAASAALRDSLTVEVRAALGSAVASVSAASMEGAHGPLLADTLSSPTHAHRDVIIAPLFLSPGRHAGPDGDLAQIARAASTRAHFTELVGTHALATETLAVALRAALSQPVPA